MAQCSALLSSPCHLDRPLNVMVKFAQLGNEHVRWSRPNNETELGREQVVENHAKVKLGKWLSELSVCCLTGGMPFGSPAPTQGTWEAETGIPGIS